MSYSYSAVTVTITPGTLASGSARQSTANTTDTSKAVEDYRIQVKVATQGTTTPAGSKAFFVWVYESDDGGATWTGNAGSADAAITLDSPHQFYQGCVIAHNVSAGTRVGNFGLRMACGGSLPQKWGIIVENQSGMTVSSAAVVCHKIYTV